MAKNYDNYGYDNEYDYNKASLVRRILIVIMVLIAILLVIYLIKSCTKKTPKKDTNVNNTYETELLNAGKNYYNIHSELLPGAVGECSVVELYTLINEGLLDSTRYGSCNNNGTFVKVCVLENGVRHFTPWLSCIDNSSDSKYKDLTAGSMYDIIADSTYVEFQYLPQEIVAAGDILGPEEEMWKDEVKYEAYKTISTTSYYRYRDKLYKWELINRSYYTFNEPQNSATKVNEYYLTSPNSYYNIRGDKAEAYKWYSSSSAREYYTTSDGQKKKSQNAVGEYTIRDGDPMYETMYRTRSITSSYSPTKYYECAISSNQLDKTYVSTKPCGQGASSQYGWTVTTFYSCNSNGAQAYYQRVGSNSTCYVYGDWNKLTTTKCDTSRPDICESYTYTYYYWYKLVGGERKYYPHGASTADGEISYFVNEPFKGAIKDTSTKATVYKWYNEVVTVSSDYTATAPKGYTLTRKTNDYKWTDWSDWGTKNPKASDGRERQIESKVKIKLQQIQGQAAASWNNLNENYVSENDLIQFFKNKGYNVNSLNDINNNGEIRYLVKMYVRNKKESM